MDIAKSVKRAPKWAWFTVAGVGVGAIAIKVYNKRDAEPSTDTGELGGSGVTTASPSPTPVLVPPVVIGGGGGSADTDANAVINLFSTGMQQLIEGWQTVWGPVQANDQAIIGTILTGQQGITDAVASAIATAGLPPGPAISNPSPVMTAPGTGPVAIGSSPQPPTPQPKCPANYPHLDSDGQGCYQHEKHTTKVNGKTYCDRGYRFKDGTFRRLSRSPGAC